MLTTNLPLRLGGDKSWCLGGVVGFVGEVGAGAEEDEEVPPVAAGAVVVDGAPVVSGGLMFVDL